MPGAKAITSITQGRARPEAALFRKDWTIKPNGRVWLDLVKRKWWTNADGKTSDEGAFTVRGFRGDYEITVTAGSKSQSVKATLNADRHVLNVVVP